MSVISQNDDSIRAYNCFFCIHKAKASLENLIQKHQKLPGSYFTGMMERLDEDSNNENANAKNATTIISVD